MFECVCDRRGLKAGFMLVPLFGLQLLLTIYRPDVAVQGARQYEYITIAVTNTQVNHLLIRRRVSLIHGLSLFVV